MSSKNHSTIYSESWEERGARQSDLESMNQRRKETEIRDLEFMRKLDQVPSYLTH